MTLNLILVRHAKSSWSNGALSDFDRPLNKRGNHDAPLMGKKIKDYKFEINILISSPAKRTKDTAKFIAQENKFPLPKIIYQQDLYHCSKEAYIKTLLKQKKKNILIIGHNPGIQEFSCWLCSQPRANFPTCGVVFISFKEEEWSTLKENTGVFRTFEFPKMFYD